MKSHTKALLCWIFNDKDSKYVKINSVNFLYLIFIKVNGCYEEINGNKYLTVVSNNVSKCKFKNMKNCGFKSET